MKTHTETAIEPLPARDLGESVHWLRRRVKVAKGYLPWRDRRRRANSLTHHKDFAWSLVGAPAIQVPASDG